jgi:hypothetical protein
VAEEVMLVASLAEKIFSIQVSGSIRKSNKGNGSAPLALALRAKEYRV